MATSSNSRRSAADEEAGGFNPARPREKAKPQVGPMPTDDPNGEFKGKKSKIDPALKRTPKERPQANEPDEYPEEGAVRRRGDENDVEEP